MAMAVAEAGAVPDRCPWHSIDWIKANRTVKRLQARIVEAVKMGRWNKVNVLQRILARSRSGKVVAIKKVTSNRGSKTAGIDGEQWDSPAKKSKAIQSMTETGYKPRPLRRVYIPKANGQQRPLGIPTMLDRAMQALHQLTLDPVVETTSDPNSDGFRARRATVDAAEQLVINLAQKGSAQWVVDADITGCFDNIDHNWLIEKTPMNKRMLRCWLKAGYMEGTELFPTEAGTPQGGIISPT